MEVPTVPSGCRYGIIETRPSRIFAWRFFGSSSITWLSSSIGDLDLAGLDAGERARDMRRDDVAVDLLGGAEGVERVVVTLEAAIGVAERDARIDGVSLFSSTACCNSGSAASYLP